MNTPPDFPEPHAIRAFVAVAIDDSVRSKLAAAQDCLKKADAAVGWVAPANIHFTILFLGAVFEAQAAALGAAMDAIAGAYPRHTLEVKGIGAFGRPNSPRIIWAGLTGDLKPLSEFQTEVVAAAKIIGIYPDAKPFQPHLTLGRVRSSRQIQELLRAMEDCRATAFGTLEIKSAHLIKSELTPHGPIYTTLHESRLSAGIGSRHKKQERLASDRTRIKHGHINLL